jgi:ubiquinone/menaquinone biosynthesis C-methylase UbiE
MSQGFQLEGHGPQAYERYLVPAFFDGCARQLLDLAPPAPGQRVLDVACGTGVVARRARAQQAGGGGTVVGVDVNESMLEVAGKVPAAGPIAWHRADAAALPFPDAAFDIVYCQQGLQFVTDRPAALREIHRVLGPGGVAAFAIWRALEHSPAFAALVQVLQRHAGDEAAAMMRAPFAWPDRDAIRDLVVAAGFDAVRFRIGVVAVRFPSAEELLRQEVISSPLAGPVGALDDDDYRALGSDLAQTLLPFADDDGIAFPMQTWLVTGAKTSAAPDASIEEA